MMAMIHETEHCGKLWPHKSHSWLPDAPYALWEECPGSKEAVDGKE